MLLQLKEFIKPENHLKKQYIGKVKDNIDPKKLKRVKVEIEGILEGNSSILPWAFQEGNDEGCSSTEGQHYIPKVGDIVEVYFKNEDIYNPIYRTANTNSDTKLSAFSAEYPKVIGRQIDDFIYKYNRETFKLEIIHPTGSKVTIDENGKYIVEGVDEENITIEKKIDITTNDSYNLTAAKEINQTTQDSYNIEATKAIDIKGDDTYDLKASKKITNESETDGFEFKTPTSVAKFDKTGKFVFKNETSGAELVDLFNQTLTALQAEPMIVNKATLTQIQALLATIQGV